MLNVICNDHPLYRWLNHLALAIALGFCVTGCAFSRTTVHVTFSPNITQPLNPSPKASLEVGEVKDTRLVGDPMVLMHKANEYGTTSGAFVTEVPVADIFRDGLKMALEQNHFTQTGGKYELHANLQNFGVGIIQHAFVASTAKPWLEVRFELIEKASGLAVWHDTYTGQVTDTLDFGISEADYLKKAFPEVAQEAVKQLLSDKSFRNFFE